MVLTGVRRVWLFRSSATSISSIFEERRREGDGWVGILPTGGTVGFLIALVVFLSAVCYWL